MVSPPTGLWQPGPARLRYGWRSVLESILRNCFPVCWSIATSVSSPLRSKTNVLGIPSTWNCSKTF